MSGVEPSGKSLEVLGGTEKGQPMWVFDGEEWTQDDGSWSNPVKVDTKRPRYEEMMPELQPELQPDLQIVEIVPLPKPVPLPPLPLPHTH